MAAQGPAAARSMPDWSSGLPSELLEVIGKRLASGTDAASFRSVCSPWRDAVPFQAFAPLLLLPFGPDSERVALYSVDEERTFSLPCGASCGWLALMDGSAAVTLLNPFTGARVELPPADEDVAAASSMNVSKKDGRWVLHPEDDYGNAAAANRALRAA
ncbi:F-box protein SKIP23-like [Panicum hallii]|uniref:F-box protein SKIP23-like n=1 Tax=Panicum hallii TaxID=206008 RepID=UPI000DF4F0BF|nr:F-box protein SKIP23-like [Panicum hallii]